MQSDISRFGRWATEPVTEKQTDSDVHLTKVTADQILDATMNKAFVREPDQDADYCPRCGSRGEPVEGKTLATYLTEEQQDGLAEPASFCPAPNCPVAYFDGLERLVLAADLKRPAYPKDPAAPICACFGLTRADIEQDVREGVATRTKAIIEKAKSAEARCREMAANGKSCETFVRKYFMLCREGR